LKRPFGIRLDGCLYATSGDALSEEEFSNAFIEFIEARGLYFGGGLYQIDEEGSFITVVE
jgi:hypothetical protein